MKLTLILFLFLIGKIALADCGKTHLRYVIDKKMKTESHSFCFEEKMNRLVGHCQGKCKADSLQIKNISKEELLQTFHSPFFKACELYKGEPREIEIFLDKRWKKKSICLFSDESFIDNESILGLLHATKQ